MPKLQRTQSWEQKSSRELRYPNNSIEFRLVTKNIHDRFVIVDGTEALHIGHSIKDLGTREMDPYHLPLLEKSKNLRRNTLSSLYREPIQKISQNHLTDYLRYNQPTYFAVEFVEVDGTRRS